LLILLVLGMRGALICVIAAITAPGN